MPVHRLAYSFGWEGSQEVPPGSSLVEIDLLERGDGTLIRFTHSGLPNAAQCAQHDTGWRHYIARLAVAAAGGSPGDDLWTPGGGYVRACGDPQLAYPLPVVAELHE